MARGVPAGATRQYQVAIWKLTPCSVKVGTSGSEGSRFGPLTASARSLPALIRDKDAAGDEKPACKRLPMMSTLDSAADLYGTCCIFSPVLCRTISILKWPAEPMPQEP